LADISGYGIEIGTRPRRELPTGDDGDFTDEDIENIKKNIGRK